MSEEVKMGRQWWELRDSRIVPFGCYGQEKDVNLGDIWIRVSFTREGWLEQSWERKTEFWWEEG